MLADDEVKLQGSVEIKANAVVIGRSSVVSIADDCYSARLGSNSTSSNTSLVSDISLKDKKGCLHLFSASPRSTK